MQQRADQVVAAVRHRAAALTRESVATAVHVKQSVFAAGKLRPTRGRAAALAQQNTATQMQMQQAAMLQRAHEQRANRIAADLDLIDQAAQQAIEVMQQQVAQLQDKGCPNAFVAGKAVEVRSLVVCGPCGVDWWLTLDKTPAAPNQLALSLCVILD